MGNLAFYGGGGGLDIPLQTMEGGYLLGGVLKGELHGGVEVVHGELVDSAEEDQEGVVYESLPEG